MGILSKFCHKPVYALHINVARNFGLAKLFRKVNMGLSETHAKLIEAARYGSEGGVRFFIKRVESLDELDNREWTALHWAAAKPSVKCAQLLLDAHANPNRVGENGDTPLHIAARLGHLDVQRLLIKSGADTKMPNRDGLTPVDFAKAKKQTK